MILSVKIISNMEYTPWMFNIEKIYPKNKDSGGGGVCIFEHLEHGVEGHKGHMASLTLLASIIRLKSL